MKPTEETNFCRVFELPVTFPKDFCFKGGIPVTMDMVDWFNPWPNENFKLLNTTWPEVAERLRPWLNEKCYVKPGRTYVLITDFGEVMLFGAGCGQ